MDLASRYTISKKKFTVEEERMRGISIKRFYFKCHACIPHPFYARVQQLRIYTILRTLLHIDGITHSICEYCLRFG